MAKAQMTSKGQITVPKEIREYLLVKAGDRIEFVVNPDGTVVIRACKFEIDDLRGILQKKDQAKVSIDEMNAAIKKRRSR